MRFNLSLVLIVLAFTGFSAADQGRTEIGPTDTFPIVIDTPLSRLDSTHRDNIVNNYFPNAGEQVILLSTDTEIDKDYYRTLKTRLSGAGSLEFDQRRELTTFREGYFWEK